jgi:hypothetical protein
MCEISEKREQHFGLEKVHALVVVHACGRQRGVDRGKRSEEVRGKA